MCVHFGCIKHVSSRGRRRDGARDAAERLYALIELRPGERVRGVRLPLVARERVIPAPDSNPDPVRARRERMRRKAEREGSRPVLRRAQIGV